MIDITEVGVIILAAGKGTRMKSDIPKVLHQINGQAMINLVVGCAASLFGQNIVVVVGHKAELVQNEIDRHFKVVYAFQEKLLGTGDAVRTAVPFLNNNVRHVLVLCGDVPLIRKETIKNFVDYHISNNYDISVFGVTVDLPTGYGRLIFDDKKNQFISICEEADSTSEQKTINRVNSGIYCIKKNFLTDALDLIGTDNVQKEYYLTDLVSIAFREHYSTGCFMGDNPEEVMGVNTVDELQQAEHLATNILN
ncbi:MAG: NTP transferase domain-containing protein [Desulfamplus sp.]|nr:NTP transferase domain-containing protein [Desulfamplus sp.]